MSMIDYLKNKMVNLFQCQYIKACIFKVYKEFHSTDTTGKYQSFHDQFGFDLNKKDFIKYSKRFIEYSKKSGTKINKEEILKTFSLEEWERLDQSEKCQHSLLDCLGCQNKIFISHHTTTDPTPSQTQMSTSTFFTSASTDQRTSTPQQTFFNSISAAQHTSTPQQTFLNSTSPAQHTSTPRQTFLNFTSTAEHTSTPQQTFLIPLPQLNTQVRHNKLLHL